MKKRFIQSCAFVLAGLAGFFTSSDLRTQSNALERAAEREVLTTTTYWNIPEYGITIRSTPCKSKTLCIDVYGINESNPKLKDIFDGGFIDNAIVGKINKLMTRRDGNRIESMRGMCGSAFNGALRKVNNKWTSRVDGDTITVTPLTAQHLKVYVDSIIDKELRAQRINRITPSTRGACGR